jgi:hypothetical protein
MKTLKQLGLILAGILLGTPLIALALNITVPSAPTSGYILQSTTTGAYVATTSLTVSAANINGFTSMGNATTSGTCVGFSGACFQLTGNDNTSGGVYGQISNINSGSSAWNGLSLNNNLGDATFLHFGGMFYNSSTYSDPVFGAAYAIPNYLYIQNTDGPVGIIASTSTTGGYINFLTGGSATSNERMRILSNGFVGIGTTAPTAKLSIHDNSGLAGTNTLFAIASSTSANLATTTLFTVLGNGNVGIGTTTMAALLNLSQGTTTAGGINFGDATANLYRSGSGVVKTDAAFTAVGQIIGGSLAGSYVGSLIQFGGGGGRSRISSATNNNLLIANNAATDFGLLQFGGTTSSFPSLSISTSTSVNGVAVQIIGADGSGAANLLVNGKVGVGTSTPNYKLTVYGDIATGGTAPTLSSCGGSPSVRGTDTAGEITVGTATTGCTVAFTSTKSFAPSCVVTNQSMSVVNAMTYTVSTTQLVISQTALSGNKINYQCTQLQN